MKNDFIELPAATSEGTFLAHYSEKGLAELDWPHWVGQIGDGPLTSRAVAKKQIPTQVLRWHKLTTDALKSVIAGRAAKELPPLDWAGKTEFQKSVWRVMLKIPAGKTKSYGEVATAIKNPRAVRAVGSACGANPIPVLVPCHRILAGNKKIGGFGGGLDWKRKLLGAEGINV